MLCMTKYAMPQWSRVTLHPSMHQIDEVQLQTEKTMYRFLFTHLAGTHGLKMHECI